MSTSNISVHVQICGGNIVYTCAQLAMHVCFGFIFFVQCYSSCCWCCSFISCCCALSVAATAFSVESHPDLEFVIFFILTLQLSFSCVWAHRHRKLRVVSNHFKRKIELHYAPSTSSSSIYFMKSGATHNIIIIFLFSHSHCHYYCYFYYYSCSSNIHPYKGMHIYYINIKRI